MSKGLIYIIMLILITSVASASMISESLQHYYKFDSNANDLIGTANGEVKLATLQTGKVNNAYYFRTNTTAEIKLPFNISNMTHFTFNFWALRNNSKEVDTFLSDFSNGSYHTFYIRGEQRPLEKLGATIEVASHTTGTSMYSTGDFGNSTWSMITFTYDNDTAKMYINGTIVNISTKISGKVEDLSPFFLVGYSDRYSQGMGGLVDELGFWSRDLNQANITKIFNGGSGISYPFGEEITLISPEHNSYKNDEYLNFTFQNKINRNFTNVSLFTNFTGVWARNTTQYRNIGMNDYSGIENISISRDGKYIWNIKLEFLGINYTQYGSNFTFTYDTTKPVINWTNPLNDNSSTYTRNLTLGIMITDKNHNVTYLNITKADGTYLYSRLYNTTGINKYNITNVINMTSYGYYTIRVDAFDKVNVATDRVTYYYNTINVTLAETYEGTAYNNYYNTYIVNISFNPIFYDYLTMPMVAKLQYEGVNHTADLRAVYFDHAIFNMTFLISDVGAPKTVYHKWHFATTSRTGGARSFKTTAASQSLLDILIGQCAGAIIHEVVHFYYHDEIDNAAITASNAYAFNFFDGSHNTNVSGSFTGATNNALCTNINPATSVYNWEVTGTINLQKLLYITRIITWGSGNEMYVSNSPKLNKNLYLVSYLNSSTVSYTWRTNQYQLIDGLMEISKCNANGTKSIVESVPIVGGNAVANINLLTSAYSYAVYIDGRRYEGDGFTPCHVESANTASYFIDINPIDIMPVIGLSYVNCSLIKVNDSVARMTWQSNDYDSSSITGCLVVYRSMVTGLREVYNYCSVSGSYSIERSIPNDGFEYEVRGELTQGNNYAYCNANLEYYQNTEIADTFGITGLLGLLLCLMAFALMYSEEGEMQIFGVIIGFVGFWLLGVTKFSWGVVFSVIAFLVIIVMVGRYSRKSS